MSFADTQTGLVELARTGEVATVLLNRPEVLNACTSEMLADLTAALDELAADDGARVVILGGRGPSFCAGADLNEDVPEGTGRQLLDEYLPICKRIASLEKPVIAAVNGPAIGVGMSLALICDLVVMAEDAYLWPPFARIGLVPDGGASWLLVRELGYHKAFELIAAGERITAAHAVELGLANRILPSEGFLAAAIAWGEAIAGGSPYSLAESKKLMRMACSRSFDEVFAAEAAVQDICSTSEFFAEAKRKIFSRQQARKGGTSD
jgi:2-(1,2-epoxy-1,2-dihydrophenyl)acetyl-CoA isomerase